MKTTGQDLLDQEAAMEAEIAQLMYDPQKSATQLAETTAPTVAGLTLQELESEILKLDEDRSSQATQQSLKLEPLDHLRLCALATRTTESPQQLLHDLLHPVLTRAERRINLNEERK